jgi:hypothetical protein
MNGGNGQLVQIEWTSEWLIRTQIESDGFARYSN